MRFGRISWFGLPERLTGSPRARTTSASRSRPATNAATTTRRRRASYASLAGMSTYTDS